MKIRQLRFQRIDIPFKMSFKHSSAERSRTESLWVTAESDSGRAGHGEGCPRAYVTGETLETAASFYREFHDSVVREVVDLESLNHWRTGHRERIDANPAAWCALELALLELLAREEDRSVEALLGLPELQGRFRYSAVIGDSGLDTFRLTLQRYREMGFTDYKIKLSGTLEQDAAKMAVLTAVAGKGWRLRLDANNLWPDPALAARYLKSLEYSFFAVEEPLEPNAYPELATLAEATGCKIVLDESLLREEQLERLEPGRDCWIVNLRVSKMGGLLRSLALARRARALGIPIIVGAQVGETSLLTRAALTVAQSCRDILVAQEGAFGTLLLERDVCDPPLMFGPAGVLVREGPPAAGFGLALASGDDFLGDLG